MEHIGLLNDLLQKCSDLRLNLYEHRYDHLAFGSWTLTIGISKRRMKFSWDGKESYLGAGISSFASSNSPPSWEPILANVGGTTTSQAQVFNFILQALSEHLPHNKVTNNAPSAPDAAKPRLL